MNRYMNRYALPALFAASLLFAGCAADLANVTSGAVGCPAHQIQISNDTVHPFSRTWTARCRGETFYCSSGGTSRSVQINCAPEGRADSGPSRTASAESRPAARVEREATASGAVLRAHLSDAQFVVRSTASPSREPSHVSWVMRPRTPVASIAQCPVGIMIDGAREDWRIERVDGQDVHIIVSLDSVRRMANAERVAARVCTREWRLSDSAGETLREFVARIDEELAWSGGATSGAEIPTAATPTE